MVDCGCFKTKLKGEKRRSDGDQTGKQTKNRRGKKYGRLNRPYLIQRVWAVPNMSPRS